MTHDEALEALTALDGWDVEADHVVADRVLCKFLRTLGYDELVDAFELVEKWYA